MFIINYFGISVATTRWVILLKSLFLPSFAYKKKAYYNRISKLVIRQLVTRSIYELYVSVSL